MRVFCAGFPFYYTDTDLHNLFQTYGHKLHAHIITDRESGKSRGFGFIEMADDREAQEAIDELDGKMMNDRALKVNLADSRPMPGR